jgi:predicted aspartyl protease
MPKYDAENFDPPAPVAHVTLRHPVTGASISDVPMLIDTGADVTLIPRVYLEELDAEVEDDTTYEVQGFSGESKLVGAVHLEMILLGKKFTGQFLVIDQPMGILGRNILNSISILFDGPRSKWDEHKR